MTRAGKVVGLLHHVGNGNLGDEATLTAVIQNIKARWPDAEIVGLTMNPRDTSQRHGIRSYPIRYWTWNWSGSPSEGSTRVTFKQRVKATALKHPVVLRLLRALYSLFIRIPRTLIGELWLLQMAFRVLWSLDVLIVCGGQQLIECSGGSWKFLGPWRFPFTLFKWVFAARLCRVRCMVLNVGATPLVQGLSRSFVKGLLKMADYTSFRDDEANDVARGLNFKGQTSVVCDSTYLLDAPSACAECSVGTQGSGVVGFSPTQYGHGRASYSDFIRQLGAFGALLVKQGYSLKLFCADIRNDPPAVEELGRILRENQMGQADAAVVIQRVHQWTTEELLRNMASMEFVVTSRFETIVFAQILNIPVLAVSGQPEVKALMNHIGLGEFCVESGECDADVLMAKFSSLVNRRNEIKRLMAEKLSSDRRALAMQFEKLFPPEPGQSAYFSRADNAGGLLEVVRKSLRRRVEQLQQWPRALFITIVLLMVASVGFLDYATGFEASVSVFYLPAIGLAAWFVGRGFAIFISILSVAVSVFTDLAGGAPFSSALLPAWNASILLAIYFVVVGLLAIARSLQREAEGQVQRRVGPAFGLGQTSKLAGRLFSTNSATAGFWTPSMANCITTALLMIGLVGSIDYATGTEVSCSAFYLPAVGFAVWFVGASFALLVSVLSVAVSLSPGLLGGAHFSKPLVATWNASILLSTYFIVVGLLAYVRSLQQQVRARAFQTDATVASPLQPPSKATSSDAIGRLTPRPCSVGNPPAGRLMEIPMILLTICQWLCVTLGTALFMAYLEVSRRIWAWLPTSVRAAAFGRAYGRHLHSVVCRFAGRNQNHSTFFLRNRAELELLCRLVKTRPQGANLDMTIFACSKGAEVYSFLWAIRSTRPDLNLRTRAMDISQEVLEFAKSGVYSLRSHEDLKTGNEQCVSNVSAGTWKDQPSSIFERMTQKEMEEMFELSGNEAHIRPCMKQGVIWQTGDAADPEIVRGLGSQDVVVANRFLCHMAPEAAEKCLRNIARVVKPGGYLFVSGVDLRVRTSVARSLGWKPVDDLLQEVYEGDISLRNGWPFGWWGVEPFSRDLPDWRIRYASVFRIGETQ